MITPVRIFFEPGDAFQSLASDHAVDITFLETSGSEARFECRIARTEAPFAWPEIPGCAYSGARVAVELHRYHRVSNGVWIAISLNCVSPPPSGPYKLRSYWMPEAGRAVLHGPTGWERVDTAKLENFDHEHDTFDFTKIMPTAVQYAGVMSKMIGGRRTRTLSASCARTFLDGGPTTSRLIR